MPCEAASARFLASVSTLQKHAQSQAPSKDKNSRQAVYKAANLTPKCAAWR